MKLKKLRVVFEKILMVMMFRLQLLREFHVSGIEKTIDYSSYSLTVEQVCRKFTATFLLMNSKRLILSKRT